MTATKLCYSFLLIVTLLTAAGPTGFCSSSSTSSTAALAELATMESKLEKMASLFSTDADSDSDISSTFKEQLSDFKSELKNLKSGIGSYASLQTKLSALKKLQSVTSTKSSLLDNISEALEGLTLLKAVSALL